MASKNGKKSQQSSKPNKTIKNPSKLGAKQPAEPTNRSQGLIVVGIGASAGGLSALRSFFDALSPNTGMAFVVITHLHPSHESHMAELLQKHTQMPTLQVTRKIKVEPNHVYVIPPNRSILMTDTHLETAEFTEPRGKRSPIDYFFRSLASEHREAIAIILSGGGTDGSVGIKDIKEQGGVIMVQHPGDAEYDSMPRAAIDTGLADVVLPASQLAEKLAEFIQHRPQLPHDPGQLTEQEAETLQRILAQVHARTGHDFNQYKRTTILRRVERRMQLNEFKTLDGYLNYLRHHASEAQAMFNDILIGVTNFFRDRDSWLALEENLIPKLLEGKEEAGEIRIWSIGCATGEEAYGLAMLLFEEAAKLDFHPRFQIFASDLDESSIARAREGLYPAAIEADVSPERLGRFFIGEGNHYRVKHELRDAVLFTTHNVLRDPPFSRQDLIACRNVLIYLQREVQEKVFDIFHYALNPGGYLFLGSSESVEHLPELFQVVDKTHRLFRAKPWQGERPHIPSLPLAIRHSRQSGEPGAITHPRLRRYTNEVPGFEEQHERALESYGPPSVIIDENHMVLHVSEMAGRYLLQPKGPITGDLLKLVRTELQMELRTAIFHAFEKDRAVVSGSVYVQFNGHPHRVVLSVRPRTESVGPGRNLERRALVLFLENELDETVEMPGSAVNQLSSQTEQNMLVAQLQSEVQHLREQLQVTIEEYDSSNEEMKAANEELQSINEEYRSATEELETSKEELQSVNEELQTVNNDMKNKLDEISQAPQELENLMGATEIGTLFLDRELRIQRFTAGVNDIINILPTDRGRPIGHLTHRLRYHSFMEDAEHVLRQLVPLEREAQTEQAGWYLLRFRPFRTKQDRIEGVVITFINITALKESEEQLLSAKETLEERVLERTRELDEAHQKVRHTRDLFHALFNTNPIPTMLTRLEDDVFLNVNVEFLNYFAMQHENVIGRSIEEIGLSLVQDQERRSREEFIEQVKKEGRIGNYELEIEHPSGGTRNVLASIQYIYIDNMDALITAFIDITDRVKAEQQIRLMAYNLTMAEQMERHRISQILHDDLQQRIFAIKMQIGSLYEASSNNDLQSTQVGFNQLNEWLDESIAITRNLSINLSPAILQGESLADALNWLAVQMHDQYGMNVTVESDGVSTKFEDAFRILLFQVVREALFNVVKHAETLQASVSFEQVDSQICLTVSDDGKGFDSKDTPDDLRPPGGLMNIQRRLKLMGCDMQVNSEPGKGTQVVIDIPLNKVKA
jgi:two-component system, chemotaxis family, CheB/CheR fusion protein